MRRTIFIHGSVRVIALLALLLVDDTLYTNAETVSIVAAEKILWFCVSQSRKFHLSLLRTILT